MSDSPIQADVNPGSSAGRASVAVYDGTVPHSRPAVAPADPSLHAGAKITPGTRSMGGTPENQFYTLADIEAHGTEADMWVRIGDRVYDVTNFKHPAGMDPFLDSVGKDAKSAFDEQNHSPEAHAALDAYWIGVLSPEELSKPKAVLGSHTKAIKTVLFTSVVVCVVAFFALRK